MKLVTDKVKFKKERCLKKYDFEFLDTLSQVWDSLEGSTFNWYDISNLKLQVKFQEKCLKEIKPNNIIEVGTHKSHYPYLVKVNLPKVKVTTFGIDEKSEECVRIVNEHFGEDFITFYLGDSMETFSAFNSEEKFDLAWIDGYHSFEHTYSDLQNCSRLGIENILVDDSEIPGTSNAIFEFLNTLQEFNGEKVSYSLKERSTDERIISWLVRE